MSLTTLRKSIQYTGARHLFGRRRLIAKANSGARFVFQVADAVGRTIYKKGTYEPELSNYLLDWKPEASDGIFVDVGANIGYYSVHMALRKISVLAFEPDPLNHELLTKNLALNMCTGVESMQLALSDCEGVAPFYRYPEKNLGRHSLLPINDSKPIQVPTKTFDQVLEEQHIAPSRIEMIKIDVEGFEPLVLKGMEWTLAEGNPTIVAEFSPSLMAQGGLKTEEFVEFMTARGYSASTLTDILSTEQVLALPPENGTNLIWKR